MPPPLSFLRRLAAALRLTRASYILMSLFLATVLLIVLVWWPLAEEYIGSLDPRYPVWMQIDWLLIGIFLFMSLLIMAGADLKSDLLILFVGLAGGLVIESWGTQTNLWHYYTQERPPLWIIPAWPIASLSIDRLTRLLRHATARLPAAPFDFLFWTALPVFYGLMLIFVQPTLGKSLTLLALTLCALLIASPGDRRLAGLAFVAGTGLGYFLELWGTTRGCWIYYTNETPPLFAVLAHGMAALAFWRTGQLILRWGGRWLPVKLPNL